MIDEIRTPAALRTTFARPVAATEPAGFGFALGNALEPRPAATERSAQTDRLLDSQQTERTIKARRMLDKRAQEPMTATRPGAPQRPPESNGNRPDSSTQAGNRSAQERPEASEEHKPQRETRRSDTPAASAAPVDSGETAPQTDRLDTPAQAKVRVASSEDKEATPTAAVPGLPGQILPSPLPAAPREGPDAALDAAGNPSSAAQGVASRADKSTPLPASALGAASPKTASPLELAVTGTEAPETVAMAATLTAPRAGGGDRAAPDASHTSRESLPQTAVIEWRPQPGAAEAGLSHSGGDPNSAARLLEAIQDMRQATIAGPGGEPGSSFAATLATVSVPGTFDLPANAAAVSVANPWPLQDPEFSAHLAGQVGEALMAGLERAEITVSPRELGPIKIELALSGENASVAFSAAHPDTREAIERSLPTLETMLAEHGLTLSHSSVSDSAQQGAGQQGGRESFRSAVPISADRSGSTMPASAASARPAPAARGLIDLFA